MEGNTAEIGNDNVRKVARQFLEERSLKALSNQVIGSFGATLSELRRRPAEAFTASIGFGSSAILLKDNGNNIEISEFQLKSREDGQSFSVAPPFLGGILTSDKVMRREGKLAALAQSITSHTLKQLYSKVILPCLYLPSARSGLMQLHKPFTDATTQQMIFTFSGRPSLSTLTKPISDFFGVTGGFPRVVLGPFVDLERQMTIEMIGGYIGAERASNQPRPHFWYQLLDERKMELYRASSAVSELAPLLLCLRYLIAPGDVVIIDEPEAHLHPRAIRILAKYMVRLVREGVNLIITTHSDYLLEQINNFILLGKVDPERRKEKYRDYEVDDFLKPEEVGAYVFNYDEQEKGYVTQELAIDEEEGLIEEEFNKVNEALYDELASLRRDVAKQSKK